MVGVKNTQCIQVKTRMLLGILIFVFDKNLWCTFVFQSNEGFFLIFNMRRREQKLIWI